MTVIKGISLTVAFLLELCMVVAFGYWGFQSSDNGLIKILLGVGTPLVAIVIWGVFKAPKSERRLKGTASWLLEFVLYGLASLALVASGQVTLAVIFAVVAIINAVLISAFKF